MPNEESPDSSNGNFLEEAMIRVMDPSIAERSALFATRITRQTCESACIKVIN